MTRNITHDTTTILLPKEDLKKWMTNKHANIEGRNFTGPDLDSELQATKKCWVREMIFFMDEPLINYVISSGHPWTHKHTSNTKLTEMVIFMYLGACVCNTITIKGKATMILRGNMGAGKGGQKGGIGGRKWKEVMLYLYF